MQVKKKESETARNDLPSLNTFGMAVRAAWHHGHIYPQVHTETGISGYVIDPYSSQTPLPDDLISELLRIENHLATSQDRQFTKSEKETVPSYTINRLPNEFFNHELKALNLDSQSDLLLFMRKWGAPLWPNRSPQSGKPFGLHSGIEDTNKVQSLHDKLRDANLDEQGSPDPFDVVIFISHKEAVSNLRAFQNVISDLRANLNDWFRESKFVRDSGSSFNLKCKRDCDLTLFNETCSHEHVLVTSGTSVSLGVDPFASISFNTIPPTVNPVTGNLLSAISNQVIDWFTDGITSIQCNAIDCDNVFKRQRHFKDMSKGRPSSEKDSGKSKYCCDSPCGERGRKRTKSEKEQEMKSKHAARHE